MAEKEIRTLETKIRSAINGIKDGLTTPFDSKIGKLFHALRQYDEAASTALLGEYTPVYEAFKQTPAYNAMQAKIEKIKEDTRKKNDEIIFSSGSRSSFSDSDDFDVSSGPTRTATAKEKPKKEHKIKIPRTPKVKLPSREKGDRDRSGYTFNGEQYGKGPLVLAVIGAYVSKNPNTTFVELKKVFPDDLLKGYGVFQSYDKAMEIAKVRKRHFLKDAQLIRLKDCNIAICNQWSFDNFPPVLSHFKKLGFEIQ